MDFSCASEIVATDANNHRVCVFSPDGSTLLRSFKTLSASVAAGKGAATPAQLHTPTSLATAGSQLYVLDRDHERVYSFE